MDAHGHPRNSGNGSGNLSFGQEQLWFLEQLNGPGSRYNVGKAFVVTGELDEPALEEALALVLERQEALRATFHHVDGVPRQQLHDVRRPALEVVDVAHLDDPAVQEAVTSRALTPFSLAEGPLCRFVLFRKGPGRAVLLVSLHHIVTDGWSTTLLLREVSEAYAALVHGRRPEFAPLPVTWSAHVDRLRTGAEPDEWAEQLAFWRTQLADLPALELPADGSRDRTTGAGHVLVVALEAQLVRSLRQRCAERHTSLFAALAGALGLVLARYTNQPDVPLGMPLLGRPDPDLEHLVGYFINMAVLRVALDGEATFWQLADQVSESVLDVYENGDVPFHRVVEAVAPHRDATRNPLFQVSLQVLDRHTGGAGL
ncbi:MAG TPA: condensation domain-containing protein, partial [Kineosporiaceae bacterium]